ncbi:hypothetical protein ACHQM5_010631 [Ranunculus cassubicifolius]
MVTRRNTTTRHRPLHTMGLAILTIAHKAYSKTDHLPGAVGVATRKLAMFLGPIIYIILYQWLSTLSFIDHRILTIEKITEMIYPPSAILFDKIDALVEVSETVPDKFDDFADKLLNKMHHVPFLNWALLQSNAILNFFINLLVDWGFRVVAEKEIKVDSNSRESEPSVRKVEESNSKEKSGNASVENGEETKRAKVSTFKEVLLRPKNEELCKENEDKGMKKVQPTYKEILEKGTKKVGNEKKKEDGEEMGQKLDIEVKDLKANGGADDPILELFASAWHSN